MSVVTYNWPEAVADVIVLLAAELSDSFTDGPFGNRFVTFCQLFFELFPKTGQGDAVFNHGISETSDFNFVFEGFHPGYW